jgi:hypothetical protein
MGLSEGAIPVMITEPNVDKISSTLSPWMSLPSTTPNLDQLDGGNWNMERLQMFLPRIREGARKAALVTADVRHDVLAHLALGSSS